MKLKFNWSIQDYLNRKLNCNWPNSNSFFCREWMSAINFTVSNFQPLNLKFVCSVIFLVTGVTVVTVFHGQQQILHNSLIKLHSEMDVQWHQILLKLICTSESLHSKQIHSWHISEKYCHNRECNFLLFLLWWIPLFYITLPKTNNHRPVSNCHSL